MIKEEALENKNNYPFDARLCKIRKVLPHMHSSAIEYIYCLRGSLNFVAADQVDRIEAGHLRSIDMRDIHYLYSDDDDNLTLIVHLDLSRLKDWPELKYVFFTCESDLCRPYQREAVNKVRDYVLSMALAHFAKGSEHILPESSLFAECCSMPQFSEDEIMANAEELMAIMLKYFNWFNYESLDDYINNDLYERYRRILAYCINNYNQKISVSELAAREHINRNYFSQFISKTIFANFSTMVKYIRCYEAEHMLLMTDMPNAEISYACGFSDPQYFYAAFSRLWRCTPKEHRRKYRTFYNACKEEEKSVEIINDIEAAMFMRDYIIKWHIEKTLLIAPGQD